MDQDRDSAAAVSSIDGDQQRNERASEIGTGKVVWQRLIHNRMVIVSLSVLAVIVLLTLAAPLIAPNPQYKLKTTSELSPFSSAHILLQASITFLCASLAFLASPISGVPFSRKSCMGVGRYSCLALAVPCSQW
jgi:hypothetical protein